METQNLLVGALSYWIQFQTTQCATAKGRAIMMFETLANQQGVDTSIQALCHEANELLCK
jgi:hypothetical protein